MTKQVLQQAQIKAIAKAAAEKFMTWELPQDFYPDNYIEFDKKYALERGIWPTGTNLMHVGQAQAMFEHCLAEALAQQEPLPPPPPECQTEAEKTAYAFGWWKALETVNREALAQQGKPVAWQLLNTSTFRKHLPKGYPKENWTPLYAGAAPAIMETYIKDHKTPLSDEQIKEMWIVHRAALPRYLCFAKAIERHHGIGVQK